LPRKKPNHIENPGEQEEHIIHTRIFFSLWILLVPMATHAVAGIENRPLDTDDAFTLDKGEFSFAFGGTYTEADNGDDQFDLPVDLGFGLTDTLEITVNLPYSFIDQNNESGFGDFSLRPEWNFFKGDDMLPALSLAYVLKLDNGDADKNIGSGAVDHSLLLQASQTFIETSLHFNLGYTFVGEPAGTSQDNTLSYKLAVEHPVTDTLTLVGEIIGQTTSDPSGEADNPLEWLLGFVCDFKNGYAMDIAGGTGWTSENPSIRVVIGFSRSFS